MRRPQATVSAIVLTCALTVVGCARHDAAEEGGAGGAAKVEKVAGQPGIHRVRLTADAAKRVGLQTVSVRPDASGRLTVAAAAVLYDERGRTWVWTQVAPLTYQRAPVTVARVVGSTAVLTAGPAAGTRVVTLGAAELRGSEEGVPGEQ
jgi:hypothetical protein